MTKEVLLKKKGKGQKIRFLLEEIEKGEGERERGERERSSVLNIVCWV